MKQKIKRNKQLIIKGYFKHKCSKCICNKLLLHNNMINDEFIVPECCSTSNNICTKCQVQSDDINMENNLDSQDSVSLSNLDMEEQNKYNNIMVINKNLNIIKCSKICMTDIFPAEVYVHKSNIPNAGLGVFSNKKFIKNEIIEIAPYIILENYNNNNNYGILKNYVYAIDKSSNVALALGFGSLYNYSTNPNVGFILDVNLFRLIILYALQDIEPHDELFINYGYEVTENIKNDINNQFPSSISNDIFNMNEDIITNIDELDKDDQQILIKEIKKLKL